MEVGIGRSTNRDANAKFFTPGDKRSIAALASNSRQIPRCGDKPARQDRPLSIGLVHCLDVETDLVESLFDIRPNSSAKECIPDRNLLDAGFGQASEQW